MLPYKAINPWWWQGLGAHQEAYQPKLSGACRRWQPTSCGVQSWRWWVFGFSGINWVSAHLWSQGFRVIHLYKSIGLPCFPLMHRSKYIYSQADCSAKCDTHMFEVFLFEDCTAWYYTYSVVYICPSGQRGGLGGSFIRRRGRTTVAGSKFGWSHYWPAKFGFDPGPIISQRMGVIVLALLRLSCAMLIGTSCTYMDATS